MRLPQMIVEQLIRHLVGKLMQASDGLLITRIVFINTDDASSPCERLSVRSEGSAEPRHTHRTIVSVPHRFLAVRSRRPENNCGDKYAPRELPLFSTRPSSPLLDPGTLPIFPLDPE